MPVTHTSTDTLYRSDSLTLFVDYDMSFWHVLILRVTSSQAGSWWAGEAGEEEYTHGRHVRQVLSLSARVLVLSWSTRSYYSKEGIKMSNWFRVAVGLTLDRD